MSTYPKALTGMEYQMEQVMIKSASGYFAGFEPKVNRFGDIKPGKFMPTTSRFLARTYKASDLLGIRADMIRLAQTLGETPEDFTLVTVTKH